MKDEYAKEPTQIELEAKDRENGKGVKDQKRKRWCREMQRRCGSRVLWELISFSGRFDPEWLRGALACTPDPVEGGDDAKRQSMEMKRQVMEARADLRFANSLDKKRKRTPTAKFTQREQDLLHKLDTDMLRKRSHDLTMKFGHGRVHKKDGSYVEIGGSSGGQARRVLDNYVPPHPEDIERD